MHEDGAGAGRAHQRVVDLVGLEIVALGEHELRDTQPEPMRRAGAPALLLQVSSAGRDRGAKPFRAAD
jgi:hypothetical protein